MKANVKPKPTFTECNDCGAIIPNKTIDLKTRVIATDDEGEPVEELFFKCPVCGRKYTCHVSDSKLRFMIDNQKQFTAEERLAYGLDLRERYKVELEEG